ncbi:MAG: hypothetical protein DWB56_13215 [Candidatus Jettenia sp.]|uniref:Uncharacterized protein n=1 Tax=Candidatus Jettenia caeni TaxID=247490 RepID=I3IQ85_9BACT|nr:hypothetical protein [Candidatus Jettenia sp. AMX1]MBC6929897.1 hypothetical protein [Candidatus Jettenia sp.]WKZ15195.1 MAG: hypothetical protein QY317_14970 [Candidatus Jettenia caeni]KAA0248561.1 MAG: hypothetical protein EDM77_12155 [Candidatus Jettenia sp. AMX1]MCE7881784.1 hypothetical protein [Candidatus Jettenia sp. AMX1]MCQ3928176.1 hypothetical protein [Candidatus Jettenia sp.]
MFSIANCVSQNKVTKHAIKDLKIGALLIFIGVNLRFAIGNIMHGLIYFDFLQSGNHEHRYEVHVPNLPDMCGDVVMAIVFAFAYIFITSDSVKKVVRGMANNSSELKNLDVQPIRQLIDWAKALFSLSIIGFGLYFFSKYFLSVGIETFLEDEEESRILFILNVLNCMIRLSSVFIFVYVYSKYLFLNKTITLTLYTFFFIRFLCATNMFGFITEYDLYIGASVLDFLTPILIIHSIISIFIGL